MVLQDAGVSRRHVRIADKLGRHYVEDLGSSNGTRVNDELLVGERQLRDGDRISLGPVEFVFKEFVAEEDATRPFMPVVEDEDSTRPIRRNIPPVAREGAPAPEERAPTTMMPALKVPEPPAPVRPEPAPAGPPMLFPVADISAAMGVVPPRLSTKGEMPAVAPPRLSTKGEMPVAAPRPPTVGELKAVAPTPSAPPVLPDLDLPDIPTVVATSSQSAPQAPAALLDPEPETKPATRARPALNAPVKVGPSAAAAPARPAAPAGLSAAEKARRRRELGETLGGQLSLWWSELSGGGRFALLTVALCFVLGMGGTIYVVFFPQDGQTGSSGPEPRSLGIQTVPDSFGLGEGVTWVQPDMKSFDFEFVSPTRAVAILRFQTQGISQEEVSIAVNAVNVGWVPADTANAAEREVQQILAPSVLKRNERNQVIFDNVRNPPGRDSWRIWNLRLEIIPVPELPSEELLETARGYVAKARAFYERKDIGAENLFLAWDNYRSAWITLEALDEKPDLYHDVRYMLGQVAADLDQKCGQLMLDFQRSIQFKQRKRAVAVLAEVKRRFPTAAHRCHNLVLEKANEHGL